MDEAMKQRTDAIQAINGITKRDARYGTAAYSFVVSAIEEIMRSLVEIRHISGSEVCEGVRAAAISRYGPMAKQVLNFWGIDSTEDIGNIVFNLVGAGLLDTTDGDVPEDFIGVYDFKTVFEDEYYER